MEKICAILTCYNRCEITTRCVKSLADSNRRLHITFVIVDDASSDRTVESLERLKSEDYDIHILHGDGNLFWCGGMRKGIAYAKSMQEYDYYMLINDDVDFYQEIIEQMVDEVGTTDKILVGATCDSNGQFSYGGVRYKGKSIKYTGLEPASQEKCHTFNANCVLLPKSIFMKADNIDETYIHTLGDFDFGLSLYKKGYEIKMFSKYVGICNWNSIAGTWWDKSLSIGERIRKKEQPKGAPFQKWFYFLKKNFGLRKALVYGFTPYIRIVLGK